MPRFTQYTNTKPKNKQTSNFCSALGKENIRSISKGVGKDFEIKYKPPKVSWDFLTTMIFTLEAVEFFWNMGVRESQVFFIQYPCSLPFWLKTDNGFHPLADLTGLDSPIYQDLLQG